MRIAIRRDLYSWEMPKYKRECANRQNIPYLMFGCYCKDKNRLTSIEECNKCLCCKNCGYVTDNEYNFTDGYCYQCAVDKGLVENILDSRY
jgi:hypothetical protein